MRAYHKVEKRSANSDKCLTEESKMFPTGGETKKPQDNEVSV